MLSDEIGGGETVINEKTIIRDSVHVLVALPERTYANVCIVEELDHHIILPE